MKEKPILFNAEMVRAILDGRKTQTRRIMTVQPESNQFGLLRITDSTKRSDIGKYHWAESNAIGNHVRSKLFACPFGAVGDRLWVRETFSVVPRTAYLASEGVQQVISPDDNHDAAIFRGGWEHSTGGIRWRPSIHMPRWASRITLEITGVRVERLASISNEDARNEGYPASPAPYGGDMDPWLWFRQLWDGIYPDQSFKVNPWVWCISFRRVE